MIKPCQPSNAGADSDSDLQSDVETMECVRVLRLTIYRWQAWYKAGQ